jgi:glycosyltransferase involved in cell wall biosynthesis
MLITFLDKSHKYDGSTINNKPLDGAVKSLILLSEALANIGHIVRVYNNCEESIIINDVSWKNINHFDASHSDLWIVHNDPRLFELIPFKSKKILWLTSSGLKLARPEYFSITMKHKPTLVIQGENHINSIPEGLKSLDASIIPSGQSEYFINSEDLFPSVTPKALFTTHPLLGLDWILDMWIKKIHTKLPWAELHIYSHTLHKALSGANVQDIYKEIVKKVENSLSYNIKVNLPKMDKEMIEEIKDIRVHLYPSHKHEVSAFSLSETQALGMPAVVRPLGSAAEKIYNGKTGFIAENDKLFSEYTIKILSDLTYFKRVNQECKDLKQARDWGKVAEEFLQVSKSG